MALATDGDRCWRPGYVVPPTIGDPRRYDPPPNLSDFPLYFWAAYVDADATFHSQRMQASRAPTISDGILNTADIPIAKYAYRGADLSRAFVQVLRSCGGIGFARRPEADGGGLLGEALPGHARFVALNGPQLPPEADDPDTRARIPRVA